MRIYKINNIQYSSYQQKNNTKFKGKFNYDKAYDTAVNVLNRVHIGGGITALTVVAALGRLSQIIDDNDDNNEPPPPIDTLCVI